MKLTKQYAISAALAAATLSSALALSAPLPPVKIQGEVAYLSGGIGKDEARTILAAAKDYPLALEFAAATHAKHGPKTEYNAAVPVTIKDLQGTVVLSTTSEGPFMLVKLPAGRYLISAERNGKVERRLVWVTGEPRLLVFEWAA
jgi:hypothetical protein